MDFEVGIVKSALRRIASKVVPFPLRKTLRRLFPFALLDPEGDDGIETMGHRDYVGGMWEEIGKLQFDFLLSKGLKSNDYLLDIACGSLRLGVKAIPYLDRSHYFGIEKEGKLIKAGLESELSPKLKEEKQPILVISDSFEFERFGRKVDFAIAQSLFTHLPPDLIGLCFKKLYLWIEDDGVFYATFFETERETYNPMKSHDHGNFFYTQEAMLRFGETSGFSSNYIGDWHHPRNLKIVEYKKRS